MGGEYPAVQIGDTGLLPVFIAAALCGSCCSSAVVRVMLECCCASFVVLAAALSCFVLPSVSFSISGFLYFRELFLEICTEVILGLAS